MVVNFYNVLKRIKRFKRERKYRDASPSLIDKEASLCLRFHLQFYTLSLSPNRLVHFSEQTAGVGCNILIDKVPEQGMVSIISDGEINNKNTVLSKVNQGSNHEVKNINSRGWLMSILNCVNRIPASVFSLKDVYQFEDELRLIYPQNRNIQAKIRQQLQFLRDKGVLEFLGRGEYKKIV